MRTLDEIENDMTPRASRWVVCIMMAGWLAMGAVDWSQRFSRYAWHNQWWIRPAASASTGTATASQQEPAMFRTNPVPARVGGDLSSLIVTRSLAGLFEETRPSYDAVTDVFGYPNRVRDPGQVPDVVVVGDSFMAVGSMDTMFAGQLADQSGLGVYNMSLMGHGPFISPLRFIDDVRFKTSTPRYLVWGFAEREIGGSFFERFEKRVMLRRGLIPMESDHASTSLGSAGRVLWAALSPANLRKSLPDSSIIAQTGEWIWTRARYVLFRQLHPWVVVAETPVGEDAMLFFSYHIETLSWSSDIRRVDRVAESISQFHQMCVERGVELIVLLIPEKEQVYRDFIPAHLLTPEDPIPPSVLWALEAELKNRHVRVVNMLPVLQHAVESGERVFWRDDTHWNDAGIRLAAERLAAEIRAESGP